MIRRSWYDVTRSTTVRPEQPKQATTLTHGSKRTSRARTDKGLLVFFRASPLAGAEFEFGRGRSADRPIKFS